jgi:hypothetical protein
MRIFIPETFQGQYHDKELFLLTRPFRDEREWVDDTMLKQKWGLMPDMFSYTAQFNEADCVILPRTINYYLAKGKESFLAEINQQCAVSGKKAFGYIAGDFGERFPEFSHLIYFRMGGFRSQLNDNNRAFPSSLSDHLKRLYQTTDIAPLPWSEKPVVGFCGQATLSKNKAVKENIKFLKENLRRFVKNPFRTDYEPLFASGYERAKLLKSIEADSNIDTQFIYREHYRGGANSTESLHKTTQEYYDNLRASQYVVCIRGGGNFSVRFFQTLLMGRIPVFVNTDCLLPFDDSIDWKKHIVWVEWSERDCIAEKILEFHRRHSPQELEALQHANRSIWVNDLSLFGMLQKLKNEL